VLTFVPGPTFNFKEIHSLDHLTVLGESVAIAVGDPSPWARLGELSALLALVFIIDASGRYWRNQSSDAIQKRALVVGGAVVLCIAITLIFSILFHTGHIRLPYMVSITFMLIVAAVGYELGRDLIDANRLAASLQESTETIHLAAEAARLALWSWNVKTDEIMVNPQGRQLYGIPAGDHISLDRFLRTVHPDDRAAVATDIETSMSGSERFESKYRVIVDRNSTRWIEAIGRIVYDSHGIPLEIRGVSIDTTEKTQAEQDAQILRRDLAHTDRVTLLGQLSSALAHELSQPLGAILRNTEAAEIILRSPEPDLTELREIVRDIHADDQRAGTVIERLRSLLKRRELVSMPVSIADVINEVCSLVRTDAAARRISISEDFETPLPDVMGDRVHLLQVLLNLVVNAMDSIELADAPERKITVSASESDSHLEIVVRDTGPGIDPEELEHIFEPFHTTKAHGMGMGLPVCRTIIEAHRGQLNATSHARGGAEFRVRLPIT
jgi:PAS domain S-box-containing protein